MSLRPRARIHLANIASNWRTLRAAQINGVTGAVVKADAYGHGLPEVVEALHEAGCDHFFVAHVYEAEITRAKLGSHPNIYVLNGPSPDEEAVYRENALIPVINSGFQYRTMAEWLVDGIKMPRGFALHFDTGMNRLGLPVSDAAELASATEDQAPILLMTHLACAEDDTSAMNELQEDALKRLGEVFPGVPLSVSNSGGVWLGPSYHHALTRPGIALYGGGSPPDGLILRPGMTLEAPILQVRQVQAGETVGYGATWRASGPTLIATLAIGYGDGFLRSASNKGFACLGGKRCPIIGRVSMDLITIDVTQVAELARPGVYAQLIGPEAPLEEQAALAGTIGYELTTGLTPRVKRIYET